MSRECLSQLTHTHCRVLRRSSIVISPLARLFRAPPSMLFIVALGHRVSSVTTRMSCGPREHRAQPCEEEALLRTRRCRGTCVAAAGAAAQAGPGAAGQMLGTCRNLPRWVVLPRVASRAESEGMSVSLRVPRDWLYCARGSLGSCNTLWPDLSPRWQLQ